MNYKILFSCTAGLAMVIAASFIAVEWVRMPVLLLGTSAVYVSLRSKSTVTDWLRHPVPALTVIVTLFLLSLILLSEYDVRIKSAGGLALVTLWYLRCAYVKRSKH